MKRKTVFSPPLGYNNSRQNQQAVLLNTAIWSVVALIVIAEFGNLLGGTTPLPVRVFNYFFLGTTLLYRHLLRKKRLNNAWHIFFIGLGILCISIDLFFLGTISSPTIIAYFLPIILAGFIFGRKGSYVATFWVSLLILALVSFENLGIITKSYDMPNIRQWIIYTAFLGVISNLFLMALETVEHYWLRAEKEIKRRKKTENNLQLYNYAVKHSPVAIIIMNAKGIIERVNPKFEQMTGYKEADIVGKSLNYLHANTRPITASKPLWATLYAGDEWKSEVRSCRKDGQRYWEKVSIAPIFDEAGEITHFVSIGEDVTEQREARLAQNKANRQLTTQLKKNKALQEELKKQALHDALTGLYNRRYMNEMLLKEFARAERAGHSISIILIDLDHLKEINDTNGHLTGDQALQVLAAQLSSATRKEDIVCRYGGDEFAIILPNTSANAAYKRISLLHQHINSIKVLSHEGVLLKISFSAGIAAYPAHGKDSRETLNFADAALYHAKSKGRNRVELYGVD